MQFVSHAACCGEQPRQLMGKTYFMRNALLATMMRDRGAVRYLVAPTGFGKTMLACSYAELINGFQSTTWIDCSNPCFLRDLDARTLLTDILDTTASGGLVVFDDVPVLGSQRREAFCEMCFSLANSAREVVVCATPVSDPLGTCAQECLCLHPVDFLYSDDDLDHVNDIAFAQQHAVLKHHDTMRVPALALGDSGSFEHFLADHIADLDDPVECALSFCMLLLERGSLEDLEGMLGREVSSDDISAEWLRPYAASNEYRREFAAVGFPFAEVLRAFTPHMARLARAANVDGTSDFALQLASILLERGKGERAANLLVALCDPSGRSAWLEENQSYMLDACMLVEAERIYTSLRSDRWRSAPAMKTASSIRRAYLELGESTLGDLVSVAGKVDYPLHLRLEAVSSAYLLAGDAETARRVEAGFFAQSESLSCEAKKLNTLHGCLWQFWSTAGKGQAELADASMRFEDGPLAPLAFACVLRKAHLAGWDIDGRSALAKRVRACLADACKKGECGMAQALLFQAAQLAGVETIVDGNPELAQQVCQSFEDRLEVQRSNYARLRVSQAGALATAALTVAAPLADAVQRAANVPTLNVSLFGRFIVDLDGAPIEHPEFKRQKLRTLTALLVLDAGHDLSCDNLAKRMWPDSTGARARHNFYNVVSILRQGLSLADGTCPYLYRPHGVVRLEKQYLNSDVEHLEHICRRLRFDNPEPDLYLHLLEQMKEIYRGELLPSERDEPMILAARDDWRNRVVNSLMLAARNALTVGDGQVALQLVQQALVYDPQREDCYEQLMSMQARCGQRPAAIETWMRYRNFLSEELGLDPTQSAARLYERIINDC